MPVNIGGAISTNAFSKELLGIIRSKYASLPLPNGEVSMDGEGLKGEGREEKQQLLEELKEFLESVSLSEHARKEQEEVADAICFCNAHSDCII